MKIYNLFAPRTCSCVKWGFVKPSFGIEARKKGQALDLTNTHIFPPGCKAFPTIETCLCTCFATAASSRTQWTDASGSDLNGLWKCVQVDGLSQM